MYKNIRNAFASVGLLRLEQTALLGSSIWNKMQIKYKIDSSVNAFFFNYRENEFNILSLETNENHESKMNKENQIYIKTSP